MYTALLVGVDLHTTDMKDDRMFKNMADLGCFGHTIKVIGNVAVNAHTTFLFIFHRNYVHVSYCFDV